MSAPRAGRKPLPPGEKKTETITDRCTPAQKAKYARLGAGDWLRRAIDRAREPAEVKEGKPGK